MATVRWGSGEMAAVRVAVVRVAAVRVAAMRVTARIWQR
jgi:hypothetical protein